MSPVEVADHQGWQDVLGGDAAPEQQHQRLKKPVFILREDFLDFVAHLALESASIMNSWSYYLRAIIDEEPLTESEAKLYMELWRKHEG